MKLTLRQKKAIGKAVDGMRFDDDPVLGGKEVPGVCRICGEEVEVAHKGFLCPMVRRMKFYTEEGMDFVEFNLRKPKE